MELGGIENTRVEALAVSLKLLESKGRKAISADRSRRWPMRAFVPARHDGVDLPCWAPFYGRGTAKSIPALIKDSPAARGGG